MACASVYESIIKNQKSLTTRQEKQLSKLKSDLSKMIGERAKVVNEIYKTQMEVDRQNGVIRQYERENNRIRESQERREQAKLKALNQEKESTKDVTTVNKDLRLGIEESLELDAEISFLKAKLDAYSRGERPFSVGKARHRLPTTRTSRLSKLNENSQDDTSDDVRRKQCYRYSLYETPDTRLNSFSRRFSKF